MVAHRMVSSLVALLASVACYRIAWAEVTLEKTEKGVVIKIDGKLFTEYLAKAGHEPALYPVIGPTGEPVTRSYPFTPPVKGGTNDHPHHQSLWMSHGDVNGIDFWSANKNDNKGDTGPHIAQRELVAAEGSGKVAKIITKNDWMNGTKLVCADERTITFGEGNNGSRWIDFATRISAPEAGVTFGDTKEGSFALRVADSMRIDAKKGGHVVNSEGKENDAAWGQPARWVDYTGPVNDETVGIAVMSHPDSFRPTPRWHVRAYGLFAANPFGQKDFAHPEAAKQGAVTIKKGDNLVLRYRIWLHKGVTDVDQIEEVYRQFVGQK